MPIEKEISFDLLDHKKFILIKGARVHNLKNVDVVIPRNTLTVVTGLSGSGKSSLAFETLYAEGQRRYVESLSAYARQFMGKLEKPDVDYIKGISPAVALEQKVTTRNPRSTVGTTTEIYDYLKLLFARIGKTYSPISGNEVKRYSTTDVCDFLRSIPPETKVLITCPVPSGSTVKEIDQILNTIEKKGFSRIFNGEKVIQIVDVELSSLAVTNFELLIDRFVAGHADEDFMNRIADSVQTAFQESNGFCSIWMDVVTSGKLKKHSFSNRFEADGMSFEIPSVNLFSFNNPYGACKRCEGFGSVIGIDEKLVIPDTSKSVYDEAVAPWKGETLGWYRKNFIMHAEKVNFPIHKPYRELSYEQKELLWNGFGKVQGIWDFFKECEAQTYKIQYRVLIARYRGKTVCPECKGTRLRADANYVKVGQKSISDLMLMPVCDLVVFFKNLTLTKNDQLIAGRLMLEIKNRLDFLMQTGLGYLTLNRLSNSLSGGESQRINLATVLGSNLVGSMYILDEPSIGLHPADTQKLISVLKSLRDIGNTVIVVEHDEEVMRSCDYLIDIGPEAGTQGGQVVFQGKFQELNSSIKSLTASYLFGVEKIETPLIRRKWKDSIVLNHASENNLKHLTVRFPLQTLTAVTGVSGSGKSTLVRKLLFGALQRSINLQFKEDDANNLSGDIKRIKHVEMVDQNPIGRSSRSNPATFVKAYDDIRLVFAEQKLSVLRGYKPAIFSFNVEGGRCEMCEGEGVVTIEMQFMADIHLPCEACKGKRFKEEVLEVKYNDLSVSEVLDLTVDDAIAFFENKEKKIVEKLRPLSEVGLGYVKLGQSSSTLSGGEAQRIKLATFLQKGAAANPTFFIFDEPTTGLHFHDIKKLLKSFNALLDKGHTVCVIEHNPEVIKTADWVIDLGPGGGNDGGNIVFEGTPEDLVKCKSSVTGRFIKL